VPEVTHAREDHRHVQPVCRFDDLAVPDGSPRLDEGGLDPADPAGKDIIEGGGDGTHDEGEEGPEDWADDIQCESYEGSAGRIPGHSRRIPE